MSHRRMVLPALLALALALSLALPALSGAGEIEVRTEDFTMDLPAGWVQIPKDLLDESYHESRLAIAGRSEASREAMNRASEFEYGFQHGGAALWFDPPYLLIDSWRAADGEGESEGLDPATLASVMPDTALHLGSEATGRTPVILHDDYDPVRNIYSIETKLYREGAQPVISSTSVLLAGDGYVAVYWVTDEDDYGRYVDVLRQAVRSIKLRKTTQAQAAAQPK